MRKRVAVNGDEEDAFYAKRFYFWRPGERKRIKRKANRRERQEGKQDINEQRE